MLQLSACDMLEEQEQSLLDPSSRLILVDNESPETGSSNVVPDLYEPHLIVLIFHGIVKGAAVVVVVVVVVIVVVAAAIVVVIVIFGVITIVASTDTTGRSAETVLISLVSVADVVVAAEPANQAHRTGNTWRT